MKLCKIIIDTSLNVLNQKEFAKIFDVKNKIKKKNFYRTT